jgi:hypothetical protein
MLTEMVQDRAHYQAFVSAALNILKIAVAEIALLVLMCSENDQLLRTARVPTTSRVDTTAPGTSVRGAIYRQKVLCEHPSCGSWLLQGAQSRKFHEQCPNPYCVHIR